MAEYRNALRAQVLQTVPASRSGEDETKTGAADFIVYRCVEDCLDRYEGYEVVLLASGDRGLREACMTSFEERGLLVAGHHSEVLRQIIAFERATDELVEVVEDFLRHKDLDDLACLRGRHFHRCLVTLQRKKRVLWLNCITGTHKNFDHRYISKIPDIRNLDFYCCHERRLDYIWSVRLWWYAVRS